MARRPETGSARSIYRRLAVFQAGQVTASVGRPAWCRRMGSLARAHTRGRPRIRLPGTQCRLLTVVAVSPFSTVCACGPGLVFWRGDAGIRAGGRSRAVDSEHRVSTRGATARLRLHDCSRVRVLSSAGLGTRVRVPLLRVRVPLLGGQALAAGAAAPALAHRPVVVVAHCVVELENCLGAQALDVPTHGIRCDETLFHSSTARKHRRSVCRGAGGSPKVLPEHAFASKPPKEYFVNLKLPTAQCSP